MTSKLKRSAIAVLAALLGGLGPGQDAKASQEASVAVAANADQGYVRQKFGEHGAKVESYVVAQGRYFGGYLRDTSLEHMQFTEIVRDLAPDLAKQRYYPAVDTKNADLLIVVHWGITSIEEDPTNGAMDFDKLQKDGMAYNAATSKGMIADAGYFLSDLDMIVAKSAGAGSAESDNAQLLGYASELQREEYRSTATPSGMTEMDRRLREELADERYFVILMAYDMGSLKQGRQGVKPKLLWSTHFSTRAIGGNFTTTLPAMSRVASNFFGHQVDGLLIDARKVPEGRVEMGVPRPIEDTKAN